MTVADVHGAGIMVAAEWLIGQDLASGWLVRVLPEWSYDRTSAVHATRPVSARQGAHWSTGSCRSARASRPGSGVPNTDTGS
jgi:DNA-binding transcriptional LysR family regulator